MDSKKKLASKTKHNRNGNHSTTLMSSKWLKYNILLQQDVVNLDHVQSRAYSISIQRFFLRNKVLKNEYLDNNARNCTLWSVPLHASIKIYDARYTV